MPDLTGGAGVAFREAIDFLRDRLALPDGEWARLLKEADSAARDRSAGMTEALARDIADEIRRGLEKGQTAAEFRQAFERLIRTHGWAGDNTAGWRADLTFRTLTAQATAAGRWRQIERLSSRRPWVRYVTAGDARVRPAHAAWHGVILRWDDPWWDTHFPPNGFNCRCHVMSLSDDDMTRYGFQASEIAPAAATQIRFARIGGVVRPVETPAGIDPGFAFNPGKIGIRPPPTPSGHATIGRLAERLAQEIGALTDRVFLSEATMLKQAAAHPDIAPADYLALAEYLSAPTVAMRDRASVLILFRDPSGRWWKAAIKTSGDGRELFLTTFHRIRDADVERLLRRGGVVLDKRS